MCRTICILRDIWAWYPPVGVFIGMLAAVSVALPFLREMKGMGKQERALWTLLMFALVFLEFKSIYQERATHEKEQEKARAEQLSQFSSIAGRIDKSIVNNLSLIHICAPNHERSVRTVSDRESPCFIWFATSFNWEGMSADICAGLRFLNFSTA